MKNQANTHQKLSYERELSFIKKYLERMNIPYAIGPKEESLNITLNFGIYHALQMDEKIYGNLEAFFHKHVQPNTILYITDEFYCQYIMLILPGERESIFTIGPYLAGEASYKHVTQFLQESYISAEWLPILKREYRQITSLSNESGLIAAIDTFAEFVWGKNQYQTTQYLRDIEYTIAPLAIPPDAQKRMDLYTNIDIFEKIYQEENALMIAVARGQTSKAKSILANIPLFSLEPRTETLRNIKNHTIVMNTLLRKAAEQGGVHPLYIDQLSWNFAKRIENSTRSDNILDLWNDMIQKYCILVNSHNTKNYSQPVQKIITKIDFDISSDLSLKSMAEFLNLSPTYLSKIFKEETGQTLTDYVNEKRMEYAAYLLANTQTPVSTIAQNCGILDDNYFSKLFKRYNKKTPTQFRQDFYLELKIKSNEKA